MSAAFASAALASAALAPGFAHPVFDAQAVFRAVLDALARPGLPRDWVLDLVPPEPLTPELAAVALALADPDAPLWLDPALAASPAVAGYLRFHTGARIVADPAEAAFALVSDPAGDLPLSEFATGTDEYPDRSTTLVFAVESLHGGSAPTLSGPGIRGTVEVAPRPWPAGLHDILRANAATFPRGLDVLLVSAGRVMGIPRSSRVVETC